MFTRTVNATLRVIYTNRQRQRCDNSAKTLAILFSSKTTVSPENGLQSQSGVTPLFSMRTESPASSQSCRSVDTDAWCGWPLIVSGTFDLFDVTCKQHQVDNINPIFKRYENTDGTRKRNLGDLSLMLSTNELGGGVEKSSIYPKCLPDMRSISSLTSSLVKCSSMHTPTYPRCPHPRDAPPDATQIGVTPHPGQDDTRL